MTREELVKEIAYWIPSKGGYKGILRRAMGNGWSQHDTNRVIAQEWAHVKWSSHWLAGQGQSTPCGTPLRDDERIDVCFLTK